MDVPRFLLGCWLAANMALCACSSAIRPTPIEGPPPPYNYTIVDPLAATVAGTPPGQAAQVPEDINRDELSLTVFPDREIPEIFWYADQLQFSLVYQVEPAPLIFLVPGTGAGPNSVKSEYLQRALFQGGYHVISLGSPVQPEFIVTASTTSIAGRPQDDARDLYRVMQLAYEQVKDRIEVEEVHLLGYSMGAWHAAFVAHLDSQEKALDFDKVLLIDPPVSLYTSAQILDNMLDENIPGGTGNIGVLLGRLVKEFATFYQQAGEQLDFSSDYLLYNLYTRMQPSDEELEALIGLAFRFTSANLTFTSDVMTNAGLIVPRNLELGPASSLTEYFEVSMRLSFINYFEDLYYPYFKKRDPTITKQDLIDRASLETIRDFLAHAEHVGLMTNEDDIILGPGQIEYLRELFGERAQIWPTGGHMGNLGTRAVTGYVVDYFGR